MNNPLINPGIGVFFWMLVSFGILAFILIKWGWPAILKSLHKKGHIHRLGFFSIKRK